VVSEALTPVGHGPERRARVQPERHDPGPGSGRLRRGTPADLAISGADLPRASAMPEDPGSPVRRRSGSGAPDSPAPARPVP